MAAEFKTIVHRIQLEPDIQALIKQLEVHQNAELLDARTRMCSKC